MVYSVTVGAAVLELLRGDITEQAVDAIVNAANSSLLGGGGVDGAIHRRGGPRILEECRRLRQHDWPQGLPPGEAVITTGGDLAARHVVHTVGPIWHGGSQGEADTLARCYRGSLALADRAGLVSIAFPSISTGAYGYPVRQAAPVAVGAIRDGLAQAGRLRLARLVLFSESDLAAYAAALDGLAG